MTFNKTILLSRFFILSALISAGLCILTPLQASAETPTQYKSRLEGISSGLSAALSQEQKAAGASAKTIASIAKSIPGKSIMEMPGGDSFNIDYNAIKMGLREIRFSKGKDRIKSIQKLAAKVQAIKDITASDVQVSPADRQKAVNVLKEELAKSRYKTSPFEQWLKKFLEARDDFFEKVYMAPYVAGIVGKIIIGLICIGFIAVLIYLVLRIIAFYSVKAPKRETAAHQQIIKRAAPSLKSLLETAQKQAAAGQFREAYRNTYIASILTLDKAKLINYADGVTNWEYLRSLSRQPAPDAIKIFGDMTASFDQLIYGKKNVSAEDYKSCLSNYRSLEETL